MKTILAATAIAIAATATALAAQPVPHLPIPKDAAVILNTGSTNTIGYRIVIESSGQAHYVEGAMRTAARVPLPIAAKFFSDMRRAMPLSAVRIEPCMKSASFGTMTFVWWRGQRSHDISCPGDAIAATLNDDVAAIADALHLTGVQPRKPLPASSPSTSPLSQRLTARAL